MKITCKKCRRLGVSVCGRERCAISRKPYPPGKVRRMGRGSAGRWSGASLSDYGRQLRDKQIVKFSYGLRELQFKNYVLDAMTAKGKSSTDNLIAALERRLDNVVYRLNFAKSRRAARQLVSHGHICVNGRKVTIPSYAVKTGDLINVRPQSRDKGFMRDFETIIKKYQAPEWLNLDKEAVSGLMVGVPRTESANFMGNISTIVEFYSR